MNKIVKLLPVFVVIIVIGAIASALFFFRQYRDAKNELSRLASDPKYAETKAKEETDILVKEIGQYILLPKDETPTVATITDVEKLKSAQPFFTNAKNGDKVLIYSQKAFIYDPVAKKIVEAGPVVLSSPTTAAQTLKLSLLNGTKVTGLTLKFDNLIKSKVQNMEITRGNAKNTYGKSLVIDLNGDKTEETKQLAQLLNIEIGTLPAGETKPTSTDFMIILGADVTGITPTVVPTEAAIPTPSSQP